MQFWLDRGVDGLRLDAVPYLIEREGTICENLEETHDVLKKIRRALDARYPDRMLLAEANQWPADVRPYFGDGDECHMAFHFPLMPRMFMAVRQEDRHPIVEILRQTPDIPENCQWAMFLRNHDELTLEMVTDEERDYMYQAYAADPQMRINVGIRRRLAPLLENSRRRIELLNSLLFSMPGTPVIYYGDEIGMGDNIYLGDRNGVRTPMQWTGDRNGGFSRADPARLFAPPIMDPVYGYQAINVEAQERSPFSLLNWMKRMIGLRKQFAGLRPRHASSSCRPTNRKVLAYVRKYEDDEILCVANLSRSVQPVRARSDALQGADAGRDAGPHRVPAHRRAAVFPDAARLLLLLVPAAAGARRRSPRGCRRKRPASVGEAPALFVGAAWDTLLDGNVRTLIERDLLAGSCSGSAGSAGRPRGIRSARFVDWGLLRRGAASALPDHRRSGVPGRRARQLFPAAGDLRGRRARRRSRSDAAGRARARHRRAQGRALRRLARQRLRAARMLESIEQSAGSADAPRHACRRSRRAAFARLRGDGPLDDRPAGAPSRATRRSSTAIAAS